MINKQSRETARKRRHLRVKKKIFGTGERPRLCVYKSLKHIYAQIINDVEGMTLVAASTLDPDIRGQVSGCNKALEKGIKKVTFDRSGYLYHGRVKALAEAAREKGLDF